MIGLERKRNMKSCFVIPTLTGLLLGLGGVAMADEAALLAKRCANRISITITGTSADSALASDPEPQSKVDALLNSPEFVERFSRFLNSEWNPEPGVSSQQDATYHMAKHILTKKEPFKNIFVGPYSVRGRNNNVRVEDDPNGLGYFRSNAWMDRYAGNETEGLRIVAGYQMLQNILGTELIATTNAPDADVSATGRQAAGCRGCHYDGWYALDNLAQVLSRANRDAEMELIKPFSPPPAGAKPVLGGIMVNNDKELVEAMVNSDEFSFNACRLSFKFLYGRAENECEAKIFDACMTEFKKTGLIRSALSTVAKDKSFCQ